MPCANAQPKYRRILSRLRDKIAVGEWPPGTRLPPERELFRSLRASDRTVLRALHDLVREGLIVRRQGSGTYVADRTHPPPISGRHLRLGVLWFQSIVPQTFGRSFLAEMTRGALRGWGVEGLDPVFPVDARRQVTRAVWHQPARGLTVEVLGEPWGGRTRTPPIKVVREGGYDGLITLGILEEDFLSRLLDLGAPAVIVDFPNPRFGTRADLVCADPRIGYRQAVDGLVAQGKRRIHFVGTKVWDPHCIIQDAAQPGGLRYGKRIDPDTFLRLAAYRQALDAHSIEVPEEWQHFPFETSDLLAKFAAMPANERPEAVVCHGFDEAQHLKHAFAGMGWPLAGAGASDSCLPGQFGCIRVDARAMGAVAARLLIERINQPDRSFLNVGINMLLESVEDAQSEPVPRALSATPTE